MALNMSKIRRQLTLFITENNNIEAVRAKYDPIQFNLIPAHVTLCREDEIEEIDKVISNINALLLPTALQINFNAAVRFNEGKGVMLPASGENKAFNSLRKSILNFGIATRKHEPHITLMHPRNTTCTDAIFEEIQKIKLPTTLYFDKIFLIEQKFGGKWKILKEFSIVKNS
jgi:2'-5' RNA ligase